MNRFLRQNPRAQLGVVLAGGEGAIEVRLRVVGPPDRSPLGQSNPGANAVAAGERVELRSQEVGHALPLTGDLEVAGEAEQALASLG